MNDMNYLTVTTDPENVCRAVDPAFDALVGKWILDPDALAVIKQIDRADLVDANDLLFRSPYGLIRTKEFSSSTKSCLLIIYRITHPELNWIPSLDSMGSSARDIAFKYLLNKLAENKLMSFTVYCTALDEDDKYDDLLCKDIDGNLRTFAEIIVGDLEE